MLVLPRPHFPSRGFQFPVHSEFFFKIFKHSKQETGLVLLHWLSAFKHFMKKNKLIFIMKCFNMWKFEGENYTQFCNCASKLYISLFTGARAFRKITNVTELFRMKAHTVLRTHGTPQREKNRDPLRNVLFQKRTTQMMLFKIAIVVTQLFMFSLLDIFSNICNEIPTLFLKLNAVSIPFSQMFWIKQTCLSFWWLQLLLLLTTQQMVKLISNDLL